MKSPKILVKLENVYKNYSLGTVKVEALKNLNLTIHEAEFAAIIGASGSGKSTLLNLIGCLDSADSGSILLESNNLMMLSENEKSRIRNEKVGFIFQSFNLIPVLNVLENVMLPLVIRKEYSDTQRRELATQALKDVELRDYLKHLPDQLSGGQRQRVAIARAIVTKPKLILADEPTANLDSKTAHKIIDLMLDLNKKNNVTFIFCSHDEKLIGRVDRVIRLQDGQVQI